MNENDRRTVALANAEIVTCLPFSLREILGRCNYIRRESVPSILATLPSASLCALEALGLIGDYDSAEPTPTDRGWEVIEHLAKKIDSSSFHPSTATQVPAGGKDIIEMVLDARQKYFGSASSEIRLG